MVGHKPVKSSSRSQKQHIVQEHACLCKTIESGVRGMTGIKQIKDLFANAVEHQNYRLSVKSSGYDDEVANELDIVSKTFPVSMKDRIFNCTNPVSMTDFFQESRMACDAYHIFEGAEMGLFKHYSTGPVESDREDQAAPPTESARAQRKKERESVTPYHAIVNYLLR